jgi:hypothetical protein
MVRSLRRNRIQDKSKTICGRNFAIMQTNNEQPQIQLLTTVQLENILEKVVERLYHRLSQNDNDDKLLSIKEAFKFLSISRTTLYNWTKKGLIQNRYIGKKPFYKKTDLLNAAKAYKKFSRH